MRMRISSSLLLKSTVVLLFCFGLAWSLRHRSGSKIDPLDAAQITTDMTLEQVVTILDDPPGKYTTLTEDELDYGQPSADELRWANDDFSIFVTIGSEGRVKESRCIQSWSRFVRNFQEKSFWQRFRNWAGI